MSQPHPKIPVRPETIDYLRRNHKRRLTVAHHQDGSGTFYSAPVHLPRRRERSTRAQESVAILTTPNVASMTMMPAQTTPIATAMNERFHSMASSQLSTVPV